MPLFIVMLLTTSGFYAYAEPETMEESTEMSPMFDYDITGGEITDISPSRESNSVLIDVESTGSGLLVITLPREAIDATIDGNDEDFFVLVDDEDVDYKETKTNTDRTLSIELPEGTEQIEIIGTFAVPEFGVIATVVLAAAIMFIAVFSVKSRTVISIE